MLLHHRADWRACPTLVDQVAHFHFLVPWALLLNLLDSSLQRLLALLCRLELSSQRLFSSTSLALAGLQLTDTVAEEVVDKLHLRDTRLQGGVLGGERVVGQRGFEVGAVDGRRRARGRLAQVEAVHGWLEDGIAAQGLLEHVLGSDVGGMSEVGRAGARDGGL